MPRPSCFEIGEIYRTVVIDFHDFLPLHAPELGRADPLRRDFATRSFSGQWTLPQGDHTLVVQAVDPAGHAAAPVTV